MGARTTSLATLLMLVLVSAITSHSTALEGAEADAPLGASHSWDAVLGMTANTLEAPLEGILVYSNDGTALVYPAEDGIANSTGELGIVIHTPSTHQLAPGASCLEFVRFYPSPRVMMVAEDGGGQYSTLYEYGRDMSLIEEHQIPFVPDYYSNLWNGYSFLYQAGRLALALADDHNVWMINKCPPPYYNPGDPQTYTSNLTLPDTTVIGNPLVVDGDFENGSMLFVPTDAGLMAFDIDVTKSELSGAVLDISLGELRWMGEYSIDGVGFLPASGEYAITFRYPHQPTTELGKEYVALATEDSRVVAYERVTGNITWSTEVNLESVGAVDLDGVHPSPDYILATGIGEQGGYLVALEGRTGEIAGNGTAFAPIDGRILRSPEFVPGRLCHAVYTDSDMIYVYDSVLRSRFVYDLSDVGLSCAPAYLGNIYMSYVASGNYIGVVTSTPELLVYPFIDYSEDSDDWHDDESGDDSSSEPTWLPWLAAAIAATVAVPLALYVLLQRRGRNRI